MPPHLGIHAYMLRLMLLFAILLFIPASGQCQGFPQISSDELTMTAEPKAPGVPAIILFRELQSDDNGLTSHQDNYIRIKVLTEEGRKYANVEIPFNKPLEEVVNIHARTIEPDGSAVEFSGETFDKTILKVQTFAYLAKTFTMPEVRVGSILEYRYTVDLKEHQVFSSHWILSGPLFTRYARFSLKPYVSKTTPVNLRFTWERLPRGVAPKEGPDHVIRLEVENIPAFQEEDFMPPVNELKSRVDFIYESEYRENDPQAYWQHVGRHQNELLEKFIDKRKAMQEAVAEIVTPNDSPEVKLRKIYTRVQQIRNKSYELRRTAQEQKREKEKIDENVEDTWKRGYGNHRQLTWLYLALVRAAGLEAYEVLVSSRNDYFFSPKTMEHWKLNTAVVLVKQDGKDRYLDPGAEFNSFGMLTWSETGVQGLRLDKDGGTWIRTPVPDSSESCVQHRAQLKLTEDGTLEGKVTTTYTGLEAMYHRLSVRNADDVTRKNFLEDRLRTSIPGTATVNLTNTPEWKNSETPLVAEFDVSVTGWTSNAGKRTLIPAGIFTAGEKHMFERTNRMHPIYVRYPYEMDDEVTIELPSGWKIDSVPLAQSKDGHIITYNSSVEENHTALHLKRALAIKFLLIDSKYYLSLRDFFQQVRTADEQPIMIEPSAAATVN